VPVNTSHYSLSVVIPAYNEEARLQSSLLTVLEHMPSLAKSPVWEIIVADDGSTDGTAKVVQKLSTFDNRVKLLQLPHRGKGSAVRAGILSALGEYILFTDADLATPMTEARKLLNSLDDGAEVAIGSRAAVGAQRLSEPFYREAMGYLFHLVVCMFLMRQFHDTQCGFKAFRRKTAHDIFSRLVLYNDDSPEITRPAVTGFDLEVLYLAVRLGYRIDEIPVQWHYRAGSKVSPLRDSYELFRDVIRVRRGARRGIYDGSRAVSAYAVGPSITDIFADIKDDSHVVR
jgi:dolichyl-phosphate beta-glucosyltransferase